MRLPHGECLPVDFVTQTHDWPSLGEMTILYVNYALGADGEGQKVRQFRQVYAMRRWGQPAALHMVALSAFEKLTSKIKGR